MTNQVTIEGCDPDRVVVNGEEVYPNGEDTPPVAGQVLNVKDFGAKGDGITDDSAAFQAAVREATFNAVRQEYAASFPVYVPPVDTFYRIGSTIKVDRTVRIFGAGGRWTGASRLVCDVGVTCFNVRFRQPASAPPTYRQEWSGAFATIEGLRIESAGQAGNLSYGVVANTTVQLKNLYVDGFDDGVFINASISGSNNQPDPPDRVTPFGYYGNANLCLLENITSWNNQGNGIRFLGSDTNAALVSKCDCSRNGGCGFLDESSLGNTYLACHAAGNGTKVRHAGQFYGCIQVHTSDAQSEPGAGSKWQDYWQVITAGVADEDWVLDKQYLRSGSYHTRNAAADCLFLGCYSEAGVQGPAVLSKNDVAIGGNLTRNGSSKTGLNHEEGQSVVSINGAGSWPYTFRGRTKQGDQVKAALGTSPTSANMLSFGHSRDEPSLNGIKFAYHFVRQAYEWIRDTTETVLMSFGTKDWPDQLVLNQGAVLGGGSEGRVRCYPSISGIPNGLEVTSADLFILTAAKSGDPGFAKVTKAGVVGSGAEITGFAALP